MSISEFFTGFKEGQKLFGESISSIINLFLISIVYLLGVGLTSIIRKLFNKEFLDMKLEKDRDTYWTDLNLTLKKKEEYYNQF